MTQKAFFHSSGVRASPRAPAALSLLAAPGSDAPALPIHCHVVQGNHSQSQPAGKLQQAVYNSVHDAMMGDG